MKIIARLRGRLTYANVTASLALFIALGGTSYAAINLPRNSVGTKQLRTGAVHGKDIRNRTIQTADISKRARNALRGQQGPAGPPGIVERARIGSEGQAGAGSTTNGATWGSNEPGTYLIHFGRDVTNCAYTATLAEVPGGTVTEPSPGRITVTHESGPSVIVHTYDAAGNPARQPFHLTVAC